MWLGHDCAFRLMVESNCERLFFVVFAFKNSLKKSLAALFYQLKWNAMVAKKFVNIPFAIVYRLV